MVFNEITYEQMWACVALETDCRLDRLVYEYEEFVITSFSNLQQFFQAFDTVIIETG